MRNLAAFLVFGTLILMAPPGARGAETRATYFGHGFFPDHPSLWQLSVHAAVYVDGDVYIGGYVRGEGGFAGQPSFPGLPGGAQEAPSGVALRDLFVARLSPDLGTVLQTTYYGGVGFSNILGLHVTADAVFIAGTTQDPLGQLPATGGAAQPLPGSARDVFVARLSRDLRTVERSTYFGGGKAEWAFATALDKTSIYVTGFTASSDLPNTQGGAQPVMPNPHGSAFVARFDHELTQVRATYLGGSLGAVAYGLAVWGGDVYVTGETGSDDFPGVQGGTQPVFAGGPWSENMDAFVARLDGNLGAIRQATYLGGYGRDYCGNLVASEAGVFFLGFTYADDFPFTAGGVAPQLDGAWDTVLARFDHSLTGPARATYLPTRDDAPSYFGLLAHGQTLYVAGYGWPDVPATAGAVQEVPAGEWDAFVAALTIDLDAFVQATHFGGRSQEGVSRWLGAEVDASGKLQHLYVSGYTTSADLPHTDAAAQRDLGGSASGFVVRLPASLRD